MEAKMLAKHAQEFKMIGLACCLRNLDVVTETPTVSLLEERQETRERKTQV